MKALLLLYELTSGLFLKELHFVPFLESPDGLVRCSDACSQLLDGAAVALRAAYSRALSGIESQ